MISTVSSLPREMSSTFSKGEFNLFMVQANDKLMYLYQKILKNVKHFHFYGDDKLSIFFPQFTNIINPDWNIN